MGEGETALLPVGRPLAAPSLVVSPSPEIPLPARLQRQRQRVEALQTAKCASMAVVRMFARSVGAPASACTGCDVKRARIAVVAASVNTENGATTAGSVGGGIFVFMDGSGEGAVNVAAGTFVRTIGSALLARSAGDVEFVRTIAAAMSARTVGGAESVSMESAVIGASLVARKRACPPTAAKLSHVKKRGGGVVPVFMGRLKQIVRIVSSAESASMVSVVISVRTAYVRASASMAVSVPNAHNAAAGANMVGFLLYAESAGQIFVYTERGVEMSARSVEAVASASTEFAVTDAKSVRGTVCVSTDGDVTVAGSVGV